MKLPRVTLRDLFWLVLVAALACAWWIDRTAQSHQAAHWRVQAIQVMSWVDQNCNWVDVGLTDDDEILILREATPQEVEQTVRDARSRQSPVEGNSP